MANDKKNRLDEDFARKQVLLKECADSFTGVQNKTGEKEQPLLSGCLK